MPKLSAPMSRTAMRSVRVKAAICSCKGVSGALVAFMSTAILPISVRSPVATTTPMAVPRVMKVLLNAMPGLVAGGAVRGRRWHALLFIAPARIRQVERTLVDMRIVGADQPQVRGHAVAAAECDDFSGDQLVARE